METGLHERQAAAPELHDHKLQWQQLGNSCCWSFLCSCTTLLMVPAVQKEEWPAWCGGTAGWRQGDAISPWYKEQPPFSYPEQQAWQNLSQSPKVFELAIPDFIACNTPSTLVAPESHSCCEREDFLRAGGKESGCQCLCMGEGGRGLRVGRGDGNGLTAASSLSGGQLTIPATQTHLWL